MTHDQPDFCETCGGSGYVADAYPAAASDWQPCPACTSPRPCRWAPTDAEDDGELIDLGRLAAGEEPPF